MDFLKNAANKVRGFFTSVFDNDDEDEKRRRRQQQQQRQRQAPSQAQRFRDNVSAGTLTTPNNSPNAQQKQPKEIQNTLSEQFRKLQTQPPKPPEVPKPSLVLSPDAVRREKSRQQSELITTGRVTPRVQGVVLTPEEFNIAARRRAEMNKKQTPKLDAAREVFGAPGKVAFGVADWLTEGIRKGGEAIADEVRVNTLDNKARSPFASDEWLATQNRSIDQALSSGRISRARADELRREADNRNRDALRSQSAAEREFKQKYGRDMRNPNDSLADVAVGAFDLATLEVGRLARGAWQGAGKVRQFLEKPVGDATREVKKMAEDITSQARSAAEERLGRKLTKDEEVNLSKQAEDALNAELNQARKQTSTTKAGETPSTQPSSQSPTQPRTREEVETSYKNIVNTINNDSNLTPDQKTEYLEAAKTQHANMLRQIDEGAKAGEEVVQEATEQAQRQQDEMAETVEQVQSQQRTAAAPEPEELGQGAPVKDPEDPLDAEVNANNAYDDDIAREIGSRRAQIDSIREAQTTPPIQSAWHWLRRNLADPLGTTQAQAGTQVADETMRIANADAATRAMLRDAGIRDIIAKYGESTGRIQNFFNPGRNQRARDFEDYRIFRDELWRMNDEGREVSSILDSDGNPLDPSIMARFVRQMDETNPEFAEDAAKLREFSLENMRTRTNMGADSREMYESSARNPFYTPRQQATPDDRVAPEIGGIHNRVATTTQGRGDAAYNVTSPMDLFVNDTRNTIRGDAAQRRAQMLIDQGMNVSQDAGAAAIRRDAMRDMQSIATRRRELQDALKSARGDRKVVRAELKGLEDRAVERMRNYFIEQATDEAGKKAARTMSREELVDVFNLATEAGEVPGKTISNGMKTRVLKEAELDKVVQGLKSDIKASRQDSTDAYQEMMDNIEFNPKTGMATVSYKVDGAVGKIEIPAEWAREWSQLDKQFNRSLPGKALDALGNAFKVTWTGTLAPMFQLKQIIMNTGLMFRNAEGLSGIDHRAFSGFIRGLIRNEKLGGNDAQRRMFEQYGAQFETATQGVILRRNIADDIVNHAGIGEYLLRNPVRTLGDLANAINRTLAHVSNAQRMAVINGAYHRGLRQGMDEEQAMRHAAMASAKVFGDFNRVSQLARNLEAVLPYSGAMQSGARAIYQASKTRPLETATKDAVILSSLAGIVAWNYQMGAGEYYKAMTDDNADYEVENNIAVATGEVTQNEDGTWNNLIKIPLTPDFRPVQRGVVQSYIDMENGEGIDPAFLGMQLFNFFTGDVSDSLWNEDRSSNPGANPLTDSVLPQSPIINTGRIIADRDTWGGGSNIDDRMRESPRADQAYEGSTSNAARQLSDLTGNLFTPIQADQMLRQFGSAGQSLRDVDEDTGLRDALGERMFNFGKIFEPRKVETDDDKIATRQYHQNIDQILHDAAAEGYDEATRAAFKALHSKKSDRSKDNLLNSAVKAAQFMEYSGDGSFSSSQLFDLEKRLDAKQREQGRPGNPLFDLAPQELQKVLMYRSMKAPNAAKQNYSKGGEAAFTALGLDEPWYQQFRDAESDYYKAIFKDSDDDEDSSTYRTFSGEKKPQLTDEQRALQDQYFALDKASRRNFLAANPWLKDYWAESNEFTDQERKALGFNSLDGENVYDGNSGSSYGRGGGRGSREDRPNTENVLNDLTNEAGTLKRLESLVGKEQAPQLMAQLKRLFASQRGGRANVPIGARSKGQN